VSVKPSADRCLLISDDAHVVFPPECLAAESNASPSARGTARINRAAARDISGSEDFSQV
jgi:hypothetical protein